MKEDEEVKIVFLTIKLSLAITDYQSYVLYWYEKEFWKEVYRLFDLYKKEGKIFLIRYIEVNNQISYDSKRYVIDEARRMYDAYVRKKPYKIMISSIWSRNSFRYSSELSELSLELGILKFKEIIRIPCYENEYVTIMLKKGFPIDMKLIRKNEKWYALVTLKMEPTKRFGTKQMGIDIGIKVPAVAALNTQTIKFFGNGREIRFMKRCNMRHIKEMQRAKQFKKLEKYENHLHHVLVNYDHKISKDIIDYALINGVGEIKMEKLTSIHDKFTKKGIDNIYLWSYKRIQYFIEYKAKMQGIKVRYVNPYHTSQKCPLCGCINKVKDRQYKCKECGYHGHRDAVAAVNILNTL